MDLRTLTQKTAWGTLNAMRLYPNQLAAHLRRGLAPIYVVAGEEPLLIQESLDAIRAKARAEGYSEREVLDVDRGFDWQRLIEACGSLSLFAAKRIVELRMPSGAPGTDGSKALCALADKPSPDLLLIVVCGKLESKQRSARWHQALETAGASLYLWPVKPEELEKWLSARFSQAGLNAERDAVRLLAERTEGNLLAAAQDIEKLRLLCPDSRVSAERLAQATADSARYDAFDLSDRVLDGDAAGAARALLRLREEGVEPPLILWALARDLRQWAQAAALQAKGADAETACARAGVWKQRVPRFVKALGRAGPEPVLGWLRACADIDARAKSNAKERAWEDLLTWVTMVSGTACFTNLMANSPGSLASK